MGASGTYHIESRCRWPIGCNTQLTGQIAPQETVYFAFTHTAIGNASFCWIPNTQLSLLDSNGVNELQSQSTNGCSDSNRETFTMVDLPAGTYELQLKGFVPSFSGRASATYDLRTECRFSIGCNDQQTGQLALWEQRFFAFDNIAKRDVTFTTCHSDFDTQLYLLDANGNEIQSTSTNGCSGDNCWDGSYPLDCPTAYRETFTMADLAF